MNDNDFDVIAASLSRTATWRRGMVLKWPSDPRNARAAASLDALSQVDGSDVLPDTSAEIEPFLGLQMTDDVLSEVGWETGFKHRHKDIDGFLNFRSR